MKPDKTKELIEKIRGKLTDEGNRDKNLNIAFLEKALCYAEDLFNSYKWIFDTYTEHKIVHAKNVVWLMYEFLEKIEVLDKLNSLELALCLLSAYYHDTGMFLTQEEYNSYLSRCKKKRQQNRGNGRSPSSEQTGETCGDLNKLRHFVRQNHGDFVFAKLQEVSSHEQFEWVWMENGNRCEIINELSVICSSHAKPANQLGRLLQSNKMGPEITNVNYMLCCVALRIADYLDFDQTRVSNLRYHSAGLTAPQLTEEEKVSKEEMQKHMQSCGFVINNREKTLIFRISAQPRDPAFENKIKNYADAAYTEIVDSREAFVSYTNQFIDNSPARENDFPRWFQFEMNKNGIVPNGYESGNYQFQASKQEILQYFTGDELYSDRTVFFRELLQNAVDTCLFVANTDNYKEDEEPHIEIVYWIEKGSRWLQITDNGAGMDKAVIQNYFLKVGASFYNSETFYKTISNLKKQNTFTSISRFGIGVLSCFMVSDHIEVATRSRGITGNDYALYSLQMQNTNDLYTLRRDNQIRSFPRKDSLDLFKGGCGTSIVLKLKPDIGFSDDTIRERLRNFVFLPKVNIEYHHYLDWEPCVLDAKTSLAFSESRVSRKLTPMESENVIRLYNGPYTVDSFRLSPIEIFFEVLSLDIGKYCNDPGINGYLYVALIYDETMIENTQALNNYSGFSFHRYSNSNTIVLMKNQQNLASTTPKDVVPFEIDFNQVRVYFNGVLHATASSQGKPYYSVCGNLSLSGNHRPDVHVSRDGNANFSLRTLSLINYAFRSAMQNCTNNNQHSRHIYEGVHLPPMMYRLEEMPIYSSIKEDGGIEELWLNERIISTEFGMMSIDEIKEYVSNHGEIRLRNIFKSKHVISVIGAYLIQKHLKVKVRFRAGHMEVIAFGINGSENWNEDIQDFPCLFFMEYEGTDHLRVESSPYNINHPLSRTVIQLAREVKESGSDRLGSYFQLLLNCLKVKYNRPDLLIQNVITPVNQILKEIGNLAEISDRDFIINADYRFDLSEALGLF